MNSGADHQLYDMIKSAKSKHPDFTVIAENKQYPDKLKLDHHCVDYMMVKNTERISVVGMLDLPKNEISPSDGDFNAGMLIPGKEWPSDHFSLIYDVVIGFAEVEEEEEQGPKSNLNYYQFVFMFTMTALVWVYLISLWFEREQVKSSDLNE